MMRQSIVLLMVAALPARALAWGTIGHRVIGEVAQHHLSPAAAMRIQRALHGRTLADVANWADELRDDTRYDKLKRLHFATVRDGIAHYADSQKDPCGDVIAAVQALTNFLRTGQQSSLDAIKAFTQTVDATCNPVVTPPIDEAAAIALLVHFIGDIHQPLHIGGATDSGGNAVKVHWMSTSDSNLHSIWDSEMLRVEELSYTEFAAFLDHAPSGQRDQWKRTTVEQWADESIELRPTIYRFPDLKPPGSKSPGGPSPAEVTTLSAWGFVYPISYGYLSAHREQIHLRLEQAGIRLAHLLNQVSESAKQTSAK
jgi:nuclease S1